MLLFLNSVREVPNDALVKYKSASAYWEHKVAVDVTLINDCEVLK